MKIILFSVLCNAVLTSVIVTFGIVYLVKSGNSDTNGGIVPGTIYPSLIAAIQANTDQKKWKDIFDSGAKLTGILKNIDWTFSEEVVYGTDTPVETCSDQTDETSCKNFGPDCDYSTYCNSPPPGPSPVSNHSVRPGPGPGEQQCAKGTVCIDQSCCKICSWNAQYSDCVGAATSGGKQTASWSLSEQDSISADRSIADIYNSLQTASTQMGATPKSNNVNSPLDITKFIQNILNADFNQLATHCQALMTKCVNTNVVLSITSPTCQSEGQRDKEYCDRQNAYIHVTCKGINDICGKVKKAFS